MIASADYRRGFEAGRRQGLLDAIGKMRHVTAQPVERPPSRRDWMKPFYPEDLDREPGDPRPLDFS